MSFKFAVINPLIHSELRLKIMVALDSLESADFMYLCAITDSSRGNLSLQIKALREAGYISVTRSGVGRLSHTVCRITPKGREAFHTYEQGLRNLFSEEVPAKETASPSAAG